ncbi:hypothetical protein ASA1KI_36030 [Opitutales bacterium ASA1]|uniref:O-antigen ligase family protein n=1 Tax=Congregicoccus parvus TaxID=3081749 RepID=UPI002B306091|nr:hypothetical protein ASA1KI_36030 [Opitutales bacterium ASA1]
MTIVARTFLVFIPLAWVTLSGPVQGAMLLGMGVLALFEAVRLRRTRDLLALWPMAILVLIWSAWGQKLNMAPPIDLLPPRPFLTAFVFASAAGVCIREYAKRSQAQTLLGLQAGALFLTAIGVYIAFSGEAAEAVSVDGGQVIRENPEFGFTILGVFNADNIVVGIISYTIYAALMLPLVLLEIPVLASIGCLGLSGLALALNLKLVTRSVFLALAVGIATVVFTLLRDRAHLNTLLLLRKTVIVTCLAAIGLAAVALAPSGFDLFTDRLADSTEDPRWDIWAESIRIIPQMPWGDGYKMLTLHFWAHNVILDAALFNGIPGLIVMIGIYSLIVWRVARAFFARGVATRPVEVYLVACTAGLLAVQMLMPPMLQLSTFLFFVYGALGRSGSHEDDTAVTPDEVSEGDGEPIRA